MKLTPHFTKAELACPCCGLYLMRDDFMAALERLRMAWGKPITVNSGFRCKKHNQAIGGAPKSLHMAGRAADLNTLNLTEKDRSSFHALCRKEFTGIGISPVFIHVDNAGVRDWTY
jgi:zinc D-Ala-D-Ala carboxypeptidase